MFFMNHVQKFKRLAERMWYAKVDCSRLNADAKGLEMGPPCFSQNIGNLTIQWCDAAYQKNGDLKLETS
jgi:hypothetical protein